MRLLGWLGFGWKVIKTSTVNLNFYSAGLGDYNADAVLLIEENSYTKEKRAFYKTINGDRHKTSVAYWESL